MSGKITLTVTEGGWEGREFAFGDGAKCLIGRGSSCTLHLPSDAGHADVSRYHCVLEVCLPDAYLRDCGSRNGTYLNGDLIGQRPQGLNAAEAAVLDFPPHLVTDGDEVQVGNVKFRVAVVAGENDESGLAEMTEPVLCP